MKVFQLKVKKVDLLREYLLLKMNIQQILYKNWKNSLRNPINYSTFYYFFEILWGVKIGCYCMAYTFFTSLEYILWTILFMELVSLPLTIRLCLLCVYFYNIPTWKVITLACLIGLWCSSVWLFLKGSVLFFVLTFILGITIIILGKNIFARFSDSKVDKDDKIIDNRISVNGRILSNYERSLPFFAPISIIGWKRQGMITRKVFGTTILNANDWSGRSNEDETETYYALFGEVSFLIASFLFVLSQISWWQLGLVYLIFFPLLSVYVRRLHSRFNSAFWILLLPLFGFNIYVFHLVSLGRPIEEEELCENLRDDGIQIEKKHMGYYLR